MSDSVNSIHNSVSSIQKKAHHALNAIAMEPEVPFEQYFNRALESPGLAKQEHVLPQKWTPSVSPEQTASLVAQAYGKDILPPSLRRGLAQAPVDDPRELLTQEPLTPQNINVEGLRTNRLDVTPFQVFIDKAVDALEGLSEMEFRVNDLIEQFLRGKVSVDEVAMEAAKLNLAVSFATSVVTTATQTFKEVQQIAI